METLRARLVEEENAEKRFSAEISPIQKPRTCPKPGSGPDKLNESRNRITKEDQEQRDFQVFRINLCPKKFSFLAQTFCGSWWNQPMSRSVFLEGNTEAIKVLT